MTEQDLIELGFKRVRVGTEESGDPKNWHYYVYDFVRGFSLITPASDEVVDDEWYVDVFETDEKIRFTLRSLVETLITVIDNGKRTL
mgnify:CR=1 FL=1|jgi:hypothetical protein